MRRTAARALKTTAIVLLTAVTLVASAGCTSRAVPEMGAPGSNTSIYSPQGVYDNTAIKEEESTLLAAIGNPTSTLPAPKPEMGKYLIYRYADLEARVNIRDGAVYQVELIQITDGQEKVLKVKSLETTTLP